MFQYLALALALVAVVAKAESDNRDVKVLSAVPVVEQLTEDSAGAAAVQSVLAYYGKELTDQVEVMEGVGTDAQGTAAEDMVTFANQNGVFSWRQANVTMSEIENQLRLGNPVIVELMAWSEDASTDTTYADDWEDGHYAVVIGMNKDNVYLMDPALSGGRGFIPMSEFQERWHNLSSSGEKEHATALFFNGTSRAAKTWERIL